MDKRIKAVVLAAGKGTRLQTEGCDLPKVMRSALGEPLLYYVLREIEFIGRENTVIVVGYQKEKVTEHFPEFSYVEQKEQLGTGHAVMSARDSLRDFSGAVLVCYGDMPLIREDTYRALIDAYFENGDDCTILAGTSNEDLPYGRIVRDGEGKFLKVVEDRDCNEEEKNIKELNVGVYVIDAQKLLPALSELKNSNSQGEYYLTDIPAIFLEKGYKVGLLSREMNEEIIGVNTVEQLRQVEEELIKRDSRKSE